MEPPVPDTGMPASPPPAYPRPPQAQPQPVRPRRARPDYLAFSAPADRRLVVGAVAGGILLDIAGRSGLATVAATAWTCAVSVAILTSGRLRGRLSRVLVVAAAVLGLVLTVRSSPWVIVPVTCAVSLLLLLGVSLGADGCGLTATFPALGSRIGIVIGHLAVAPGTFQVHDEVGSGAATRQRALAVARGVLLGAPVVLVVGLLLAWADPIFRSWFDLRAVLGHLELAVAGAWLVAGLFRAASARQPAVTLRPAPSLGTVEAALVLGGLCALYATFVGAQLVALSGGGHYVLVTQGLTYAQYARSGFFQLLACAAITLLVLLGVRACAKPEHPVLKGLSGVTIVLTIGVVIVAIRRLQLYEAAFGLTMLRLACLVVAAWIGIVFLLLGATLPRKGLPSRMFPAVVIVSGLVVAAAWGAASPASIVALTNVHRAEHGHRLDISQAARLGPDAVPALLASLRRLDPAEAAALRRALCALSPGRESGAAFNLSRSSASRALARTCASPG